MMTAWNSSEPLQVQHQAAQRADLSSRLQSASASGIKT
jgi:hypothetical protein